MLIDIQSQKVSSGPPTADPESGVPKQLQIPLLVSTRSRLSYMHLLHGHVTKRIPPYTI